MGHGWGVRSDSQGWNMALHSPKGSPSLAALYPIPSTSCLDTRHQFVTCSQIQSNFCESKSLDLSLHFDSADPSLRHSTRRFPLTSVASGTASKHIPRDNCRAGLLSCKAPQCWQQEK